MQLSSASIRGLEARCRHLVIRRSEGSGRFSNPTDREELVAEATQQAALMAIGLDGDESANLWTAASYAVRNVTAKRGGSFLAEVVVPRRQMATTSDRIERAPSPTLVSAEHAERFQAEMAWAIRDSAKAGVGSILTLRIWRAMLAAGRPDVAFCCSKDDCLDLMMAVGRGRSVVMEHVRIIRCVAELLAAEIVAEVE